MRKENYREYLRLRREARYVVEYALMLAENLAFYDGDALVSFLDDVVRYLGSEKEYERFGKYKMQVSV